MPYVVDDGDEQERLVPCEQDVDGVNAKAARLVRVVLRVLSNYNLEGEKRPKDFRTMAGSKFSMVTYKKEKS